MRAPHVLITNKKRGWNGEAAMVTVLARGLAERGYRVTLATNPAATAVGRLRGSGVRILPLTLLKEKPQVAWTLTSDVRRLVRYVREQEVALIHSHASFDTWTAALAVRSGRLDVPLIRTKHNLKPIRDTFTNRYYYRTAIDWLIAPSKAARDHLLETPIVPGYKVVHIPNGIALDRAATFPGDRRAARRELGLPSDAEVVLYASRLSKNKDPATLVRAIQRISASRPRLHCLVAGDGSPEIRAEMERLLVAGSAVILLGQRDDVPRLLAAADLFVLPSVSESFGLAPLEAMLARVPVIVSDCPGFMDYVRDRENAVVFPRRDDAALAAEIDRLLDDPRLRRCLAAEGERTVLGYFNADRMIDDTERLYLKILGEGSGETLPATATALS